jgi:hypothetical protein
MGWKISTSRADWSDLEAREKETTDLDRPSLFLTHHAGWFLALLWIL